MRLVRWFALLGLLALIGWMYSVFRPNREEQLRPEARSNAEGKMTASHIGCASKLENFLEPLATSLVGDQAGMTSFSEFVAANCPDDLDFAAILAAIRLSYAGKDNDVGAAASFFALRAAEMEPYLRATSRSGSAEAAFAKNRIYVEMAFSLMAFAKKNCSVVEGLMANLSNLGVGSLEVRNSLNERAARFGDLYAALELAKTLANGDQRDRLMSQEILEFLASDPRVGRDVREDAAKFLHLNDLKPSTPKQFLSEIVFRKEEFAAYRCGQNPHGK